MAELTQLGTVKDPVCGMQVSTDKAAASSEHSGKQYYFCGNGCAQKFTAHPEQYTPTEIDPVCGMKVVPARSCRAGRTQGQDVFLLRKIVRGKVCH